MRFKKYIEFLWVMILVSGCAVSNQPQKSAQPFSVEVLKNTREVVMLQEKTWENQMMGYFKVLKVKPGFWQMWYSGWNESRKDDYSGHLLYAYSADGKKWVKEIPGQENNILRGTGHPQRDGIVEQDVFIDEAKPFKYQMIYTARDFNEGGREKTYIEESKDGYNWVNKRLLWNEKHDSQFSVVQRNGQYYIYNRYWELSNGVRYRTIGLTITDRNWKTIVPQRNVLVSDFNGTCPHLYNPGAAKISSGLDILFPTYFNEKTNAVKFGVAYNYNNKFVLTDIDLTKDILEGESSNWGIISPGLIPAGKNLYWIYYYATNMVHSDYDKTGRKFKYYRVKVRIKENK